MVRLTYCRLYRLPCIYLTGISFFIFSIGMLCAEYYDPINHGDPVGASATGGKRVREHLWRVIFDGRKWYMTGGTGVPEEYYTQAVAHEEDAGMWFI